jgi:glycosyltransferase 2 family protein
MWKARYWLGAAASIFFLGIFVLRTDVGAATDDLLDAEYVYLLPAMAVFVVAVWFRAWRWATILHPFLRIRVFQLYPYVVIGSMANNVLPARAGELLRTYMLGERYGVKKMTVLGTVAVDRLFDGLALLAIYVVVAFATDTSALLTWIAVVAAIAFGVVTVAFLCAVYRPAAASGVVGWLSGKIPTRFREKFEGYAQQFLTGLEPLRSTTVIAAVMALSLLAWFSEATMYYLIGFAFDLDQPFYIYLLVAAAANLVIALPPSQGGIGPFELVTREVLVLAGVGASEASAYALTLHAALLLPVILLGAFFLWLVNFNMARTPEDDRQPALIDQQVEAR